VFQAKAQVDSDQTLLSKADIRAPINGLVLERNIEPGQTVAASFQTPVLFTLAEDLSQMRLHVDIDEADIGQIATGQKARFSVDAFPERKFKAEITKVHFAPKIVQDVVTYEALLQVNNQELILRPGMTATADIISQQIKNALQVPNAALRFTPPTNNTARRSRSSVLQTILPGPRRRTADQAKKVESKGSQRQLWLLVNGEPQAVPVTTGVSNGRMTEILSGDIEEGSEVIVDAIRIKK
ncbi:MAG: efflux RND transporter periplasmic adaptor subunit, partial [Gammaproteobacteria bacterium]|nr:efflux RND transporter periplasmic adaptor subunit [Gammaproteobacteria bacterium]